MTDNDLFYVCALIEYTARRTKNRRGVVASSLGVSGIKKQLRDASVNHCLSFEQVSDEIIETYSIPSGSFDTISGMKYSVPDFQSIGKLYAIIIQDLAEDGDLASVALNVFTSFLSDEISDFSTDLYYQNQSYLEESYKAGTLLP